MKNNPFDRYTEEYEAWFRDNDILFRSELLAIKQLLPPGKRGVEIGIGSGIFAERLGIRHGVDPSDSMLAYARKRKLNVSKGVAEHLPYPDRSFDFAVFITSICFIDDPECALGEARRVIREGGDLVMAFIDRKSPLGKSLETMKSENRFYRHARFFSVEELVSMLGNHGFEVAEVLQTLIDPDAKTPEKPVKGHGQGSFVVIRATKVKMPVSQKSGSNTE